MAKDPKLSRGYRNKNPGNIDFNPANKWQGQVGIETTGSPPRFAVFESPEYGIRALAMLLNTYQDRHGLRTVRGIINRWAPPVENVTSAYVAAVSRHIGVGPDDVVDMHSHAHLRPMVEAIITHELGGQPYDAATIDAGLRLAGITPPVSISTSSTVKAAAATAAAGVALQPILDAVVQSVPALMSLQDLSPWVAGAVVLGIAAHFIAARFKRV